MTVKVTVKDTGAKRAQALLRRPRKVLRIGILEREAAMPHPSGNEIGEIAVWNEFGTPHAPARSWLFDWLDENVDVITRQLAADTLRVLFGKPPESEEQALGKRGSAYRRQIIGRIRRRIPPPNAPSTLRRKQGDVPLIDTRTFLNSIRWEVK